MLTVRKSEHMDDWWIIDWAEHDGREWIEWDSPHGGSLRCSSRPSDADIEGTGEEMLCIAEAIEQRGTFLDARRCAVASYADGHVVLWSPRNSQRAAEASQAVADDLAKKIRALVMR